MKSSSSSQLIHGSIPPSALGDIEVFCVNNGSPDGSREILAKRQKEDARTVIADKPNGGLSPARNAGMAACRSGPYPPSNRKYTGTKGLLLIICTAVALVLAAYVAAFVLAL